MELRRRVEARNPPPAQPVLRVLAEPAARRLVLLGDAGSGKSTLARYLALVLAGEASEAAFAGLAGWLPLLVDIRDWAAAGRDGGTVPDLVDHLHATAGLGLTGPALEAFLAGDGRAVAILDGLDRVDDPRSWEAATERIAAFADRYRRTRIVVTSRMTGYRRRILDAAGFTHHLLQDLDREQVEAYARRWCAVLWPGEPGEPGEPGAADRLLAAVDGSAALRDLATNPLLLSILSVDAGRREPLPDGRAAYERVGAVLAGHRPADGPPAAPVRRYQEAARIIERHAEGDLSDDDVVDVFRTRWADPDWRGVLPHLMAGVPGLAGRVIDVLLTAAPRGTWWLGELPHHALSAIRCLAEVGWPTARTLRAREIADTVVELLETAYESETDRYDERWTQALAPIVLPLFTGLGPAWSGRRRYDDWYRLRGRHLIPTEYYGGDSVLALATRLAAALDPDGAQHGPEPTVDDRDTDGRGPSYPEMSPGPAVPVTPASLDDRYESVRVMAIRALADSHYYAPDVVEPLRRCLGPDSSANVRAAATRTVAVLRHRDPESGAILRARVNAEANPSVREDLLRALVDGWPDADTATVLHARITTDADWDIRQRALRWLAGDWRENPETVRYVRGCALFDPDWQVRQIAVRVLLDGWRDEPGTVRFLHGRALHDRDADVRLTALEALRDGWRDDPRTLRFLRRRATGDLAPNIRQVALVRLVEDWRDDPGTVAFLRGRITDDHWVAREFVLTALATCWPDLPGTVQLVRERAMHDPDERVRCAALRALATGWPDDPATRALLWDRALLDGEHDVRTVARWSLLVGWPDELPVFRQGRRPHPGGH